MNNNFNIIYKHKRLIYSGVLLVIIALPVLLLFASTSFADTMLPTLSIDVGQTDNPDAVVPAIKIIGILTILAVAPAILLMTSSFARIMIVLSFTRQALGTQTMPPNQVLVGLALFLTFFTMSPVLTQINKHALQPYINKKISQQDAINSMIIPMKKFMLAQTREKDLGMFINIAHLKQPKEPEDVSMSTLMPAFLVSELKTAFQIGFLIYIPFLVIDMVVSSTLMAMGMLMLPPTIISLPFKLVLFVLVDGWSLIVEQVIKSFNMVI